MIAAAVAGAEHGHKLDRALTAEVTAMCGITGVLFPDQGYDMILARTFGMPGVAVKPGTVTPSGPALSKARVLLGEQVMRRVFEIDAARTDLELGIGAAWHGMETTGLDGTTIELFSSGELADAFGVPAGGSKPKIRIAAHARTGSRRWIAAAVGGYHDGENTLADELGESFTAGIINLADRGFFSMDRWIRFSARGAHLAWRVKNGAKSVPFKTIRHTHGRVGTGAAARIGLHAGPAAPREQGQDPAPAAGHRRAAGQLHHLRPHRPPGENHHDQGAHHPAGPGRGPGPRDRRPVRRKMADRDRRTCT